VVRIAHLSDPHFGTEYEPAVSALPRVLAELQPDLVVLSGDITQRARVREFQAARAFLDALPTTPVMAVPGNHDLPLLDAWTRVLRPYARFQQWIGSPMAACWQSSGVEVFTFNSTSRWRHKNGVAPDLRLLLASSASAVGGVRLAVMHHPLVFRAEQDARNRIRRAAGVLRKLMMADVDLVLGGHIHDPIVQLSDTLYPGLPRRSVVAVAGTCLSTRVRSGAPNSFNVIDLEPGSPATMAIERWDLGVDGFRAVVRHRFVRMQPGRWGRE